MYSVIQKKSFCETFYFISCTIYMEYVYECMYDFHEAWQLFPRKWYVFGTLQVIYVWDGLYTINTNPFPHPYNLRIGRPASSLHIASSSIPQHFALFYICCCRMLCWWCEHSHSNYFYLQFIQRYGEDEKGITRMTMSMLMTKTATILI